MSAEHSALRLPLSFTPQYMQVVWGGRRLEAWRPDLPPDVPIGESWELADHQRGMSVVASGELAGQSLESLMDQWGKAIVGSTYQGGPFPLLIKIIDAQDKLSVQVHPDDALAQEMGLGNFGKTECWLLLADGGELYQGTKPGIDQGAFEQAMADGSLADTLNVFPVRNGDFFFLPARTVHAIGAGCLILEVQQNCDITFRVDDWGRLGLDGKPRPLHQAESLRTIDFSQGQYGAVRSSPQDHSQGGSIRPLVACDYFQVEERRARQTGGGGMGRASIITIIEGSGTLATAAGSTPVQAMGTYLVSACAGPWSISCDPAQPSLRFCHASPC
ncbi:MAG: mannose-6-phosphate isomerase [Planctomycetota bacterium]|nr:MAG: mannose-6-phosphate isomerase [Planctomycetota bacterium]